MSNWVIDFSVLLTNAQAQWLEVWKSVARSPVQELPPPKIFKPKFDLPLLPRYDGVAPQAFWDEFPSNRIAPAKSLINADVLKSLALDCGFNDLALLNKIFKDLHEGADIGCAGEVRKASRARNAPSAHMNGEKVTDAIADWIVKGFAYGPVQEADVPPNAKLSGIMTRAKPSGSVRIILNLSAPKGFAVNEGIDNSHFPTVMSSTTKWVRALWLAGKGCWISKVDWADAYKHCAVREQDLDLQWFKWLGRYFCELCLIFGCVSSAGIFDRIAKLVLFIVKQRAGMPSDMVCQHLDDCCAAAPASSTLLHVFDAEFYAVAKLVGVKLAPRDDPEKSFAPCTSGVVLGLFYDTVSWTWAMPQEKLIRLMVALRDTIESDEVMQEKLWSITGKILNVLPLVPGGRFNIYHLLLANSASVDPRFSVVITPELKRQLWFWINMLRVCSGRASIPRPDGLLPPWAIDVYTDAAGGSSQSHGHGVGAVALGWWVFLPWGRAINTGRPTTDGKHLDRVLSALELVGPLLGLCAAVEQLRGLPVRFHVDNAGSVFIWKKGYSTSCQLSSVLVSALASVAAGLGCRVEICKIRRCSVPLAEMADALSKSAFGRFWHEAQLGGGFQLGADSLPVPRTLLQWIANPLPDFDLGDRLLRELAESGPVLGY